MADKPILLPAAGLSHSPDFAHPINPHDSAAVRRVLSVNTPDAVLPQTLPPNDYHLTLPEERAEIASLRSQLAAARVAARVLAHSYDHDSNPPPWALEEARKWDAYGREAAPDREALGRCVRAAWIRWAQTQPDPKPSWLVPWEELSESHKEADRQMGEAVVEAVKGGRGA